MTSETRAHSDNLKHGLLTSLKVLIWLAFVVYAFNVDYSPATGGLDPSWQYIINYGFAQRLDFSFTSGPLGFINYPMNVGVNPEIAIIVRLIFWLMTSAWFGLIVFENRFPLPNLLVFIGLLGLGGGISFDYWVCFIGLLLLSCAIVFPRQWLWMFGVVIVFCAFLALVKLSAALLLTAACVMFGVVLVWVDRRKAVIAAGMMAIGIPAMFALMYLAYRPSFTGMLTYLKRSRDISSGYNVAMSIAGSSANLWLALVIGAAYMLHVGLAAKQHRNAGFVGLLYLPAVFLAFKHGFVRQDGHESIFFAVLALLFALLWLFTPFTKRTVVMLSLLVPILIPKLGMPAYRTSLEQVFGIPKLVIMAELLDYKHTRANLDAVTAEYLEWYRLPSEWTELIGPARVSIFPWEAAYAPANHLNYVPFPVIQAYSAYTAYLDAENAHFLADSATAPDFVLIELVGIDQRHTLIDVPATWRELYCWYEVIRTRTQPSPLALLQRRARPRLGEAQVLRSEQFGKHEALALPSSEPPIFMSLRMELTLSGKLMKWLFRVPPVMIELREAAGARRYRIVPDTLTTPLLINRLPMNIPELSLVLNDRPWQNRISAIALSGEGLAFYRDTITVEFFDLSDAGGTDAE